MVLTLTLLAAGIPAGVTHASSSDDVTITANTGNASEYCPFDFSITAVSPYEIQLEWQNATGNATDSTVVRAAYGRLPQSPDDGFAVYSGNDTDYTHWVNTEFIDVDVYYRLYTLFDDGEYSICYAEGFVSGGLGMIEIGSQLGNLADYSRVAFILGFPLILGLVGAWRHSLSGYLAGIAGFALAIPLLDDTLGLAVVIPASIFIVGLLGAGVRDAFGEGLNIV